MSAPSDIRQPTTETLCGEFTDPATVDPGQYYSAPIKPTCAAPSETVDGEAEIIFIDGQAVAIEV